MTIAEKFFSERVTFGDSDEYGRLVELICTEQGTLAMQSFYLEIVQRHFLQKLFDVEDITLFSMLDRSYTFLVYRSTDEEAAEREELLISFSILGRYFSIMKRVRKIIYNQDSERVGQVVEVSESDLESEICVNLKESLTALGYFFINSRDISYPVGRFYFTGLNPANFSIYNVLFRDSFESP